MKTMGRSPAMAVLKDIRKLNRLMSERNVKQYMLDKVARLGGEARKVRWEGMRNAPDWRVWLPGCNPFWIELKASKKKPTRAQAREMETMKRYGEEVYWANSPTMVDVAIMEARYA